MIHFFLSHRGPEATHTRVRAKFGIGPNKKEPRLLSRGGQLQQPTIPAQTKTNTPARSPSVGPRETRPQDRYRGKRRLPARPSLTPVARRRRHARYQVTVTSAIARLYDRCATVWSVACAVALAQGRGQQSNKPRTHTRRADRELRQQRKADFPQTRCAPPRASRRARRASARPNVVRPPPRRRVGATGGARERRARSDGRDERRIKEEEEKSTQRANAPARLRR